jgi:hypothetical protein
MSSVLRSKQKPMKGTVHRIDEPTFQDAESLSDDTCDPFHRVPRHAAFHIDRMGLRRWLAPRERSHVTLDHIETVVRMQFANCGQEE